VASYTRDKFVATAGQTTFTTSNGYTLGYLQVFVNGILLDITDYTANDSSTVVLTEAADVNDEVVIIALDSFAIAEILRVTNISASAPNNSLQISSAGSLINDEGDIVVSTSGLNGNFSHQYAGGGYKLSRSGVGNKFFAKSGGASDDIDTLYLNNESGWSKVDVKGKVGINVTSNTGQLSVASPDAATLKLVRQGQVATTGNSGAMIEFNHSQAATSTDDGDSTSASIQAKPISGWGGRLSFSTNPSDGNNNTAPIERLIIDAGGRVTTPYQPSFMAFPNTAHNISNLGGVIPYNSTNHNVGGHYNTTTSRFTAPFAGVYLFMATFWAPPSTKGAMSFRVNGNTTATHTKARVTGSSDYEYCTITYQPYLNAGDYVDCVNWQAGTVHVNFGYNTFTGRLCG